MSDQRIPISQLSETQTAPDASYIAIDDGSLTKKITVENFNSTSTASAQQYANQAAASAQTVEDNIATSAAQIREATLAAREATQASTSATASATSAYDSASLAQNYSTNASTSAGQAMNAADSSAQNVTTSKGYAEDSEAWAVGKRNGSDVSASDETYQNNAKYYASSASGSATRAEAAAQSITVPDTTLTISGVAAESKVTGDRISSVNAELVDIRVKADGTTAATAGDAVREQITELKSDLNNINGSQIKTKQIDYSILSVSENKKITGYDSSTYVPLFANESGSFVADIAISDLVQYSIIKFPRCSKSSQWFIIYSDSQAWNFVKTSHSKTKNYDLSNDDYGIINCKWLASTTYTRIAIASDNVVDITVDSQFNTFFDLMDSVKKNNSASVDIRKLYYVDTIDIAKQATSTYVPFVINSGETLTFTNNTSGNVSLYAIDASNNRVLITNGITAGQSVMFTAAQDFIQILYWAQQLGSVSVGATDAIIYRLENAIKNSDIASVNMFGSIAAIGDSYTAGSTKNSAGTWVDYRNLSWIATMGKRSGTEWKNYGHGGATTKSFLETTEFTTALSDNACDCYFFALGQNDGNQSLTIGTVADIHDNDYTQNPETFYGCYGKIIQQIKNHAPNAKLVMVKNWVQGATWTDYDTAIEGIAAHYGIPCISPFDDYFFSSELYQNYKEYGHPTAMGYSSMGLAMERLFSKCVNDNPSYFKFATIG